MSASTADQCIAALCMHHHAVTTSDCIVHAAVAVIEQGIKL
jgi:hypothetical protein